MNLKFTNAFTNSVYTVFISSCIAFSSLYTLVAAVNASLNGVHVASVYLLPSKPLTLSINAFKVALSPLIKSNICIALASLSNALFTSACVALASA